MRSPPSNSLHFVLLSACLIQTISAVNGHADAWVGIVVNNKTNDPIKGVFVGVIDPESNEIDPKLFAITAGDGQFKLNVDGTKSPTLCVAGMGFAPQKVTLKQVNEGNPNPVQISLERGGFVLEGKITDPSGKPIKGATIIIEDVVRGHSDEQGNYRVDRIPPVNRGGTLKGHPRTSLYPIVSHPDYVAKDAFQLKISIADGKLVKDFTLDPGASVEGIVSSKVDGKPLKGIEITAGQDRFGSNVHRYTAKTDEHGKYRLKGVPVGPQVLHALSEDWSPVIARLTLVGETTAHHDFTMEPGEDVSGKVVDSKGHGVEKAWIITDTWQSARMFKREAYSDADGKFTLKHMPSTSVQGDVLKKGFVSSRRNSFIPGKAELVITLSSPGGLSGRLLDAKTKEPVREFRVARAAAQSGRDQLYWTEGQPQKSEDGSFHLEESEFQSPNLFIQFRSDGYRSGPIPPIALKAGQTIQNQEILLEPSTPVTGFVKNGGGEPVPAATVRFFPLKSWSPYHEDFDPTKQKDPQSTTSTKTDGSFVWKNAESRDYGVFAFKVGVGYAIIGDLSKESSNDLPEIRLEPFASIEGIVYEGGNPLPIAPVNLSIDRRHTTSLSDAVTRRYQQSAVTDREGRYRFDNVLGNTHYRIYLKEPTSKGLGGRYARNEPIYARSGEHAVCIIGGEAGSKVSGRISASHETSVVGAEVSLSTIGGSGSKHYATRANAKGEYELRSIAPGTYNLRVEGLANNNSPRLYHYQRIRVLPNQDLTSDVSILPRIRILPGITLEDAKIVDVQNQPLNTGGERALVWFYYPDYEPSTVHINAIRESIPKLKAAHIRVIPVIEEFADPELVEKGLHPIKEVVTPHVMSMIDLRQFQKKYEFPNSDNSALLLLDSTRKVIAIIHTPADLQAALERGETP